MHVFKSVNNYCERLDPSFWAEPINALSNFSFILFAFLAFLVIQNRPNFGARLLTGNLLLIGIGSFLFHSFAQVWAEIADVLPILLFILTYIFFASRQFLNLSRLVSAITVIGFFPYAAGASWVIGSVFGPLNGSVPYVSVALIIAIYGILLIKKAPQTAFGLFVGSGILLVSIGFRSIDQSVCDGFPLGTHFVWHLLNGLMLGWMIVVLSRHAKD